MLRWGFPGGSAVKNLPANAGDTGDMVLIPEEEIPWRRKWPPTPVFLPGKFHGQRSMAGYSPWGCKESTRLSVQANIILKPPTSPGCRVEHRHLGFSYTPTCFPGLSPITKLQSLTHTLQDFPRMPALSSYAFINAILSCLFLLIKSCIPQRAPPLQLLLQTPQCITHIC